jgi:hypothetical protein
MAAVLSTVCEGSVVPFVVLLFDPFVLRKIPTTLPFIPSMRAMKRRAGRRVGRLAEMIPADISMAVQPTVGARV